MAGEVALLLGVELFSGGGEATGGEFETGGCTGVVAISIPITKSTSHPKI